MNVSTTKESFVTCHNSQGLHVRGTLMHLSERSVVFEVYNPFSIIQMSEVLSGFEVHVRERTLYSGKAVVRSLLNTGIMLVAEATLVDSWQDIDILSIIRDSSKFRHEVTHFLTDWETQKQLLPDFKAFTADFHSFLDELSMWLEQVEVGIHRDKSDIGDDIRNRLVEEAIPPIRSQVQEFLGHLNHLAMNQIPAELEPLHKAYIRRELHPVTLCSPFIHRTFTKPLGYAGDYEMINMLLSDPRQGKTIYAKSLNSLVLEVEPARAHRNRISILTKLLEEEGKRVLARANRFKVLNIACGPAKEVRDYMLASDTANFCDMTLLDFSPQALEFCTLKNHEMQKETSSGIELRYVEKSIDTVLRDSLGKSDDPALVSEKYHFVYCAGLFDYLIDSVCSRLITLFYNWVLPDGLLAVTNIHPRNPQRKLMEYLLEWNVIHRDERHLAQLNLTDGDAEVVGDDTGVNIFLKIRNRQTAEAS